MGTSIQMKRTDIYDDLNWNTFGLHGLNKNISVV